MRPETALGWALCAYGAALPVSVAAANIGWGLVAAALAWGWRGGERPAFAAAAGPLWRPLLAFLAAAVAADALGADPAHSFRYLNQDAHKLWLAALLSVAFASGLPRALPVALLASAAAMAAFGVVQYAFSLGAGAADAFRAHGFVHPVTYGEQLSLLVLGPIAYLAVSGPERRRERLAAAAAAVLMTAALALSNTRAAIAAASVGVAALAFARPALRRYAPAALLGSAALVVAADLMFPNRSLLMQLSGLSRDAAAGDRTARLELWRVAFEMGADHPWTGVGVNNYRALLPGYLTRTFEDSQRSWGTAHSLYFHHFAERGLAGSAALAWLLWVMLRRAWERAAKAPGLWTLWAWGAAVAFLVMNVTEVALQTELVWMLLWTLWLAAEAQARREGA